MKKIKIQKIKDFECFRTESSDSARNSKEFRHDQKLKFLTSEDLLR